MLGAAACSDNPQQQGGRGACSTQCRCQLLHRQLLVWSSGQVPNALHVVSQIHSQPKTVSPRMVPNWQPEAQL